MTFDESKHPRDEQGRFTEKTYTEESYGAFHKMFYADEKNSVFLKKEKGNNYYIDESYNGITKLSSGSFQSLDKYFDNKDVIKLKLPNKKIRGKNEYEEDNNTLKEFINKGFEIKAKYNDGWNTNYVLTKKKEENIIEKIKSTKLEKYKPTKYTIDWGRPKQQGKRLGQRMYIGHDMSLQGKKEYTNILGSFPEEEQKEAKQLFIQPWEQYLYAQAREYGLDQKEAEKTVLKVYNSYSTQQERINLGKKY